MTIIEIRGGPITHRYLMNKSKRDLADMYMALLRFHEWRPIEDAPKDGTAVLLYSGTYHIHVGSWLAEVVVTEPGDGRSLQRARWICWSNRTNDDFEPTHWMPLPEPPDGKE